MRDIEYDEQSRSTMENTIMDYRERSVYLSSIPWVKEHTNELKSVDKGNLFIKFKDYDTEFSLIPVYNDRTCYFVIVHTLNDKVKEYMDSKNYKSDQFGQNYFLKFKTFANAVSYYISLVRTIRDTVLCIDKESNEDKDKYSTAGTKLTVEEIKERIDQIHVGNSPVDFSVRRGGVVYATSSKIKYGAPTIKLVPKSFGYDLDIFVDRNLNSTIQYELIDYIKDTLGIKRSINGSYVEQYNDSFNVAYNKFRDVATDVIVFILNHRIFKESVKSRKRKR